MKILRILGNSPDVRSMWSSPERSFVTILKEMMNRFPFDLAYLGLLGHNVLLGDLAFSSILNYFPCCTLLSPSP